MIFKCHYGVMAHLVMREPSRLDHIPPADRFFVEFYWKQKNRADRCKIALLREQLLIGEIDEAAARRAVPGPNLKLAAAKAEWEARRTGSEKA